MFPETVRGLRVGSPTTYREQGGRRWLEVIIVEWENTGFGFRRDLNGFLLESTWRSIDKLFSLSKFPEAE